MPFVKGKSGNPGGRPKGIVSRVKELVGEDGEKALEILWGIAKGTLTITRYDMNGEEYQAAPGFKERLSAVEELLNRGFGKPGESIELTGKDGEALVVEVRKIG